MNSIYSNRSILKIGQFFFILISTLLLSKATLNAQTSTATGWQQWEKIYSDSYIAVELQYYYSNSGCDPSGKQFKFRGRLTGQYRTTPLYVNFKTDYIDCDGNLYWKQNAFKLFSATGESVNGIMDESLDNRFPAASIDLSYYDVQVTSAQMAGSGFKAFPTSKDPTSVQGRSAIYYGEQTKLTVKGGQLGIGADWVWYKDSCGVTKIGTGASIEVAPIESVTYYVRAEGTNNTTNCATTTVTVDRRSIDPNLIQGKTEVCKGTDAILTVSGGSLGLAAKWVWYTDGCGSKKIGEGSSITISPISATAYFVRAESAFNITNCAKLTVNVVESSEEPTRIKHNLPGGSICQGQTVELNVKGGRLAKGAVWAWYSGACGSSRVGSGETISQTPSSSTAYYVRAEGVCNTTDCATVSVTVNSVSSSPSYINVPEKIFKGKKATLSVSGGNLGKEAQWAWYKGTCGLGAVIGRGSSIAIRPRGKVTYAVRAEGACNNTNCAITLITPLKTHKFERTYNAGLGNKKFLHIGYGFGAEWQRLVEEAEVNNGGTSTVDINGYGVKGEFAFHPFIKEYLSIGFIASGAIGTAWPTKDQDTDPTDVTYIYKRFNLNSELAFGFKGVKFLFALDKMVQPNEYSESPNSGSTAKFNGTLKSETLSSGFRFGHYTRSKYGKRGDNVDLTYKLSRNTDEPFGIDFDQYKKLSDWNVGFGFSWWRQSKFKLQFDARLKTLQANIDFGSPDFHDAQYNLSFIWNRNLFY